MLRLLGLGPAVFVAIVVIALFIFLGIAIGKLRGITGVISILVFTAIVICAVFFWPTYQPGEPTHQQEPIDTVFFPRVGLLVFLLGALSIIIRESVQYYLLGGPRFFVRRRPIRFVPAR